MTRPPWRAEVHWKEELTKGVGEETVYQDRTEYLDFFDFPAVGEIVVVTVLGGQFTALSIESMDMHATPKGHNLKVQLATFSHRNQE